ncbi:MAG: hypothetical protein ACRDGK_09560, partial [Actinomycetota bacterium]
SSVAALITGVVVGGFGARLAMRLSAMATDDSRIGMITENGNRIGDITGGGTVGLVLFVGLVSGLATGIFLFALRTVLPARFLPLSISIVLLGLGGVTVIDPGNPDFTILGNRPLNVAMFMALFPAFACLSIWLAERFDRWLARRHLVRSAPLTMVGTAGACLLGVLGTSILVAAAGPIGGTAIVIVAVLGSVAAFAHGSAALWLRWIALVALAVGTAAGLATLVQDVETILG